MGRTVPTVIVISIDLPDRTEPDADREYPSSVWRGEYKSERTAPKSYASANAWSLYPLSPHRVEAELKSLSCSNCRSVISLSRLLAVIHSLLPGQGRGGDHLPGLDLNMVSK